MSGVLHGVVASLKAAAAAVTDAFFEYVTLLLHGDGTNGAQNNTFLDSSTNNFSITRNGNTTQGSFSPFSQTGWSNYFDGTGDYLTFTGQTINGDFCAEAWYYRTGSPTNAYSVIFGGSATSGANNLQFIVTNTGAVTLILSATVIINAAGTAATINQWNHVVWCRSGSNCAVFVNGVRQGTGTSSDNTSVCSRIGDIAGIAGYQPIGYISNARLVIGSSVYDPTQTTLTVPTAPLTAITNTSLLTCQSNRFIDNSSNNFAITRNGDVRVEAFSPFSPTAAWSASTNGGSGYFDGTGDYLTVPNNAAFQFGTGNFTIELWYYPTQANTSYNVLIKCSDNTSWSNGWTLNLSQNANNQAIEFYSAVTSSTQPVLLYQWNHIVVSRSGTTLSIFCNGVRVATATNSTNYAPTNVLSIGADAANLYAAYGYFSNVRVVKGTAVYDPTLTTLTVPTAPLTAITNTSLLLNFTNGGIFDNASQTVVETVGNAQISTAQFKWGTGSLAFDGTGDWLLAPDRPEQRFSTGPFTVEMWVYRSASGTYGLVAKGTATTGWMVSLNSSNQVVFSFASSSFNSTGTVAATTWTHIAVVREGTGTNQTKIYIGGTNDGTSTVNTDFNQTNSLYIGADRTGGSNFNGYIDDLRITTGYARYTANFTPPTAAFPDQ